MERPIVGGLGIALYVAGLSLALLRFYESDAIAVPLAIGACVVLGLAVGEWWALALVLIILPLVTAQPCAPPCRQEVPPWYLALVTIVPPATLLIALGVGVRQAAERRWEHPRRRRGSR